MRIGSFAASLVVLALIVTSCAEVASYFRPAATEVPFCAPFERELGGMHLDFAVTGSPEVQASEAEAAARTTANGQGITCSVRLAKYDNLDDHRALVWVVHLDGLAMQAAGGSALGHGAPPSPPMLRRALILVSVDKPARPLSSLATTGH